MITLAANVAALVADDNKTGRWAIHIKDINDVGYSYYSDAIGNTGWGLQGAAQIAWSGSAWFNGTGNNSIVIMDFDGIELRRNTSEAGIIAPSDVTFTVSNPNNTLAFSDFKGGTVLIELFLWNPDYGEQKFNGWRFNIKTCEPGYQKLKFTCEDFLQEKLRGYYPNTRLPEDIFPSDRSYIGDMVCVPVPFGTAYIPLRDVYITNTGYLVLGDPAYTYNITKVRNPRSFGMKSEWDSGSYTFTQSTKTAPDSTTWRVFQAIIADSNDDTVADTHGFWGTPGGPILDTLVQFSRYDTKYYTNPARVILFVLNEFGIATSDINSTTYNVSKGQFTTWMLTFNGAFWYKQDRVKVLSSLLIQCHSCLDVGETISLRVLSNTSRATITSTNVIRLSEQGEGTFSYQNIVNEDLSDCGYIAFQESGEAQDSFKKVLVSTGGTATVISSEVLEVPFVQTMADAQRIGTLYYQRKLGKIATVSFTAKSSLLAIQPDDVISISQANYGGSYDVLVDSIKINKDLSIQFSCTQFNRALSDWEDLTPTGYSIPVDDTTHPWSPVITGPDSPGSPIPLNAIADRLRVGNGSDYMLIEPATVGLLGGPRISVYNSGEKYRAGNLNGFLGITSDIFGFGAGSHAANQANIYYDATPVTGGLKLRSGTTNVVNIDNAGNITISSGISASTIDIGGSDATSFHVDIDGNMWLGAAAFNIATNPFAVSNAGVMRAVSGTIGGWTLAAAKLSTGTDADYIGFEPSVGIQMGDSTFADAPFSVTKAGVLKAVSGAIGGWTLAATTLTGTGITLSSTGDAYLAIGTTPPTSPTVGTGIFINKTGLFGLNANNSRFKILEDGSGFLGASTTIAWTSAGAVTIAGFTTGNTDLTKTSSWNTTIVSSGATAFTVGPTGSPTFTVTQAGVLTTTSGYIGGSTNGWAITAGKLSALGTGLFETSTSASTGIKINSTALYGYNGSVQTVNIATDGSGWFGLTGTKAISWTTAGVATIGGLTANATSLWQGGTGVYQAAATTLYVGQSGISLTDKFSVTTAGALSATSGTIGGWILDSTLLQSAAVGAARIVLDQSLMRISIKDATNASKVVMGYLNGLSKHDGTGNWGVGDYGFWAVQGDKLVIDGDGEYKSGDWIVMNDGAYLIQNAAAKTIVRLGTDTAEKGLFIYEATGVTQLAKFVSDKIFVGEATKYLQYTVAGGLVVKGVITADTGYIGGTSGWVISANYIKDVAGVVGLSSVVTAGDDIRFWAGHATPASAPFYVTEAGALVASSATIVGDYKTSATVGVGHGPGYKGIHLDVVNNELYFYGSNDGHDPDNIVLMASIGSYSFHDTVAVFGTVNSTRTAVYAASSSMNGINCSSVSAAGIYAASTDDKGVWGVSQNNYGIYGQSSNSYAIYSAGTTYLSDATTAHAILPHTDNTENLGSATYRWANIYTADLHLANDRGDYTLIEEEYGLTVRNNKTNKLYSINMTEIPNG